MKLLLSNNQLTRYSRSGDYATTTAIPLDGELSVTAQTLLHGCKRNSPKASQSAKCSLSQTARTRTTRHRWTPKATNHNCDFKPRQAIRRRDRSRRRRFTLRSILQRSPSRRTAGRVAGRMGRHRGDAVSYLQHHLSTVERGALGTFASLGSAAVSMVSHLEVYLRVAGLCVGLAVGIVTLLSVYHDLRKKQKENK
jgi:hypothetical protein